jgi:hypothetical protein
LDLHRHRLLLGVCLLLAACSSSDEIVSTAAPNVGTRIPISLPRDSSNDVAPCAAITVGQAIPKDSCAVDPRALGPEYQAEALRNNEQLSSGDAFRDDLFGFRGFGYTDTVTGGEPTVLMSDSYNVGEGGVLVVIARNEHSTPVRLKGTATVVLANQSSAKLSLEAPMDSRPGEPTPLVSNSSRQILSVDRSKYPMAQPRELQMKKDGGR